MDIFQGDLVRLAHIHKDQIPTALRWLRDYETMRLTDDEVVVPMTDEAEQNWYDSAVKDDTQYSFAIRTLADDTHIGNCGLFSINQKDRSAMFGILVGEKDYWGKGYGTDATRLVLRFAFWELNLNRVELEVFDYNPRAIRAYEKAGFVREGVRRDALFREGAYHDIIVMGILREDWGE